MSHFVADACMPCHMDARKLSGYSKGLHKELEAHWSKLVGTYFDKKKLFVSNATANTILNRAREIDQKFNVTLPNQIADLKNGDIWLELMMICRASFALICTMAHPDDYPYTSQKLAKYETLFGDVQGKAFLKEIDKMIIHDAILNIAIAWKHVWKAFD